eukprot:3479963-Lingulodinium_polyedra.AAC.1
MRTVSRRPDPNGVGPPLAPATRRKGGVTSRSQCRTPAVSSTASTCSGDRCSARSAPAWMPSLPPRRFRARARAA